MCDTDVAIEEFKRLVKSGYQRGHAINLVAEKYNLEPHKLACKMSERSLARNRHSVPGFFPNNSVQEHAREEDRIRRIQESGFAIPDEAQDIGIDPAHVV